MTLPCVFCNKRCNYNGMRANYWCKDCKVHYDGEKEYLHNITFDTTLKNVQYELTIDAESDLTTLRCWRVEDSVIEMDALVIVMQFKPAMKNITPQNVNDKIRTLLTYS